MVAEGALAQPVRDRVRLFLARAFGAFGGYWEERLRCDSRRAETDMVESAGEGFYAQLYLEVILGALAGRQRLRILDAGCQAGRLAIPLARAGHSVTGVDIAPRWLERCRDHCRRAGVEIELICDDIGAALSRVRPGVFDAVVCTELLYTRPDFATLLAGFRGVLGKDGRLFASHRTRYYMATTLARYRKFADAAAVLTRDEGDVLGQYFNWFDEEELRRRYREAGFSVTDARGIGALSGIGVDGLAGVVDPAGLSRDEQTQCLRLEQLCALRFRWIARYLLVTAEPTTGDRP